jgi:hypothetical protein
MIKLTSPRTVSKLKQSTTSIDVVSANSSAPASPWILDLGPGRGSQSPEAAAATGGGRKKLANPLPHHVLKPAHFVRIKDIVVRKVSLTTANGKKAAANSGDADIWSPSLATYLFNQQKEARDIASAADDGDESATVVSIRSGSVSFRLHLDRIPRSSTRNGSSPFNIDLW